MQAVTGRLPLLQIQQSLCTLSRPAAPCIVCRPPEQQPARQQCRHPAQARGTLSVAATHTDQRSQLLKTTHDLYFRSSQSVRTPGTVMVVRRTRCARQAAAVTTHVARAARLPRVLDNNNNVKQTIQPLTGLCAFGLSVLHTWVLSARTCQ